MKRRAFLQNSLASAGTLLIPASAAPAASPAASGAAPSSAGLGKMTLKALSTDLLVVGGGMAGVCAALAAARNGTKVILVQDRSVLGGNASSEIKMHIVGADCSNGRPGRRESGLLEELRLEDAVRNPQRCYPLWDLLLYEKVKAEPNITLLLDTDCVGCAVSETGGTRRITTARVVRNMTEEAFDITATYFADCSGDSRLAMEAGADFTVGREDKLAYLEDLARDDADKQTLGSTILFTAKQHDQPMPFIRPDWVRKFDKSHFKFRTIASYGFGYWWAEWGGQIDTLKDNDEIRHELLRVILGIWDYIKNSGEHPNSANWALDWIGAIPGKRETRRLFGDHILTQDELQEGAVFPDAVAYGGWPIDLHEPSGIDITDRKASRAVRLKHLYTIPLRSLYSRNVSNLLMAGRNISASHVAFGSTRVMGTCAVIGQAVGTAAAHGVAHLRQHRKVLPNKALAEPVHCRAIQQMLLRDDAFVPSLRNEDSGDLARDARVTASSVHEGAGGPDVVLDGHTREMKADWGPWADEKPHAWTSATLPAWLQLDWSGARAIREVHLTFDSGFERLLVLTCADGLTKRTIRGAQPELVRDYSLLLDGKVVASVQGNFLRKRIHRFDTPLRGRQLRLRIDATNGESVARVFEVRAY